MKKKKTTTNMSKRGHKEPIRLGLEACNITSEIINLGLFFNHSSAELNNLPVWKSVGKDTHLFQLCSCPVGGVEFDQDDARTIRCNSFFGPFRNSTATSRLGLRNQEWCSACIGKEKFFSDDIALIDCTEFKKSVF